MLEEMPVVTQPLRLDKGRGLAPRIKQAYDLPPKSQGHFRDVTTTNRPSADNV